MSQNFDLQTFTFEGHELRTKTIDGEPWLVAVDVLRALGIEVCPQRGVRSKLDILDPTEKRVERITIQTLDGNSGRKAGNPAPNTTLISESGFYKLTMRAQRSNPTARKFQDWVTKDVLPRIRRDGAYIMGEEKVATGRSRKKTSFP